MSYVPNNVNWRAQYQGFVPRFSAHNKRALEHLIVSQFLNRNIFIIASCSKLCFMTSKKLGNYSLILCSFPKCFVTLKLFAVSQQEHFFDSFMLQKMFNDEHKIRELFLDWVLFSKVFGNTFLIPSTSADRKSVV